jgi:hypothetical protein
LSSNSEHLASYLEYKGLYSEYDFDSYEDLFLLINTLTYLGDYDIIADMIDLAVKRNHKDFSKIIFENNSPYKVFNRTLNTNNSNLSLKGNLNITNGCVFIVQDLNMFVYKLKNKGYVVNAGPQK